MCSPGICSHGSVIACDSCRAGVRSSCEGLVVAECPVGVDVRAHKAALRLITSYTRGFLCFKIHTWTLQVFRNQVPDTHEFSGTRYLLPTGFQAQSGTVRHSQARPQYTLVTCTQDDSICKKIYATVLYSCTYALDVYIIWHICIINLTAQPFRIILIQSKLMEKYILFIYLWYTRLK